jgi:hypothetical protein
MSSPTSRPPPIRAKDRVVKPAVPLPAPAPAPVPVPAAAPKKDVVPHNPVKATLLKSLKLSVPRVH